MVLKSNNSKTNQRRQTYHEILKGILKREVLKNDCICPAEFQKSRENLFYGVGAAEENKQSHVKFSVLSKVVSIVLKKKGNIIT